ncbi:hypothetical protein L7F22_034447, partial [Adiantum nelumboides]|nr:hypothetical protein [Adiantum nelumboides]
LAEPACRLCAEFHCPSHREGPAQFPVGGKEWRWVDKSSRPSKVRIHCFFTSHSSTATIPQWRTGNESLYDHHPCWLQKELIAQELRQVEVKNGELELYTERGGIGGGPYAGNLASKGAKACMELGRDGELYGKETAEEKAHSEKMISEVAPEEDIEVKNTSTKLHVRPQNDVVDYVNLLKKCAEQGDLQKGITTHADLIGTGLLENNVEQKEIDYGVDVVDQGVLLRLSASKAGGSPEKLHQG